MLAEAMMCIEKLTKLNRRIKNKGIDVEDKVTLAFFFQFQKFNFKNVTIIFFIE